MAQKQKDIRFAEEKKTVFVNKTYKVVVHDHHGTAAIELFLIIVTCGSKHDALWLFTIHSPYFSQNMVSLQSRCTCQHVCVLHRFEAGIWWGNNGRLVHSIVKTMRHGTTRTVFQSDQGPDQGWNNRSLGILTGLWPETDGNVHHWCSNIPISIKRQEWWRGPDTQVLLYNFYKHYKVMTQICGMLQKS